MNVNKFSPFFALEITTLISHLIAFKLTIAVEYFDETL